MQSGRMRNILQVVEVGVVEVEELGEVGVVELVEVGVLEMGKGVVGVTSRGCPRL